MTPSKPRRVLMIAYPGAHNLDVVGPLEILATTAYFSADGVRPYDIAVVAETQAGPSRQARALRSPPHCPSRMCWQTTATSTR
jgi:hypothetical protein